MNDDQFARALLTGAAAVFMKPYFDRFLHFLAALIEKAEAWRQRRARGGS